MNTASDSYFPRESGSGNSREVSHARSPNVHLVDRVRVHEPAALLLCQVEPEAQAPGVDPPIDDLAQPIIDDGAGIDPAKIAAKAIERGLVSQAQLAAMTPREIMHLIFLPGFSLAAKVTNVSGRGVGMDVVKTRIEGIGGSVDVTSRLGKGSTFRLTIPLTLAIIPALTIGCAGRRYAVPKVSVLELVRLSGEHARGGIELISGAPVYRLRDMLLPLVRLDEQLGLVPFGTSDSASDADSNLDGERGGFIVVLHAEQQRFGWWWTTSWTPRRSSSSRSAAI
jgi:hypothetical protein